MDKIEFLEQSLQRIERWITLADAKAGVILVAIPAALGLCGSSIATFTRARIDDLRSGSNSLILLAILYGILLILAAVSAVYSFYLAFRTVMPRLTEEGEGLLYFGHIQRKTVAEWTKAVDLTTREKILDEYVRQTRINSIICWQKYGNVAESMKWLAAFFVLLALCYAPTLF